MFPVKGHKSKKCNSMMMMMMMMYWVSVWNISMMAQACP